MRKTEFLVVPISIAAIFWMLVTGLRAGEAPTQGSLTVAAIITIGGVGLAIVSAIIFALAFNPPHPRV